MVDLSEVALRQVRNVIDESNREAQELIKEEIKTVQQEQEEHAAQLEEQARRLAELEKAFNDLKNERAATAQAAQSSAPQVTTQSDLALERGAQQSVRYIGDSKTATSKRRREESPESGSDDDLPLARTSTGSAKKKPKLSQVQSGEATNGEPFVEQVSHDTIDWTEPDYGYSVRLNKKAKEGDLTLASDFATKILKNKNRLGLGQRDGLSVVPVSKVRNAKGETIVSSAIFEGKYKVPYRLGLVIRNPRLPKKGSKSSTLGDEQLELGRLVIYAHDPPKECIKRRFTVPCQVRWAKSGNYFQTFPLAAAMYIIYPSAVSSLGIELGPKLRPLLY